MDEENLQRDIPLAWIGAEDLPLLLTNQFVVQVHEGTFFLTIGQMVPPALIGTPDERVEQLRQIAYVPVKPVARLALTPTDVRRLASALNANLDQLEQTQQEEGDGAL